MPIPGLSLVGFCDQHAGVQYLQNTCVPANPDPVALAAEWTAARAKLGPPVANAGMPDIQPLPPAQSAYVAQLYAQPWAQQLYTLATIQFAYVEIDPLLAYQLHISDGHAAAHGNGFSNPPTMDELLAVCLQQNRPPERWTTSYTAQSMLITAKDLNVRSLLQGPIAQNLAGLVYGIGLPWLHVVRFNGRCYLHNGFHRALAARRAGATHFPCVFRDVVTAAEVGIRQDGGTFTQQLLESNDPPTLAHYTGGRGYDVQLRIFSRALHVSWAEYVVPEE